MPCALQIEHLLKLKQSFFTLHIFSTQGTMERCMENL